MFKGILSRIKELGFEGGCYRVFDSSGDITWLEAAGLSLLCLPQRVRCVSRGFRRFSSQVRRWRGSVERIPLFFDVSILAAFPRQGG